MTSGCLKNPVTMTGLEIGVFKAELKAGLPNKSKIYWFSGRHPMH